MSQLRKIIAGGPKAQKILTNVNRSRGLRRTRQEISRLLSKPSEIWLEIGSGPKSGANGWVTLDFEGECDLYWDLRDGIPFPDSSISRIYSSHLFEHLTYSEGQGLMSECLRALRPGGEFSICVPNARLYIDAYARKEKLTKPFLEWSPAVQGDSFIDMVNYVAYLDGHHKCLLDEESLVRRMQVAGFSDACLRTFDPLLDSKDRDFESIYAIGHKPGVGA